MITKAAYPNIKTLFAFIFVALKVASVSGSSMPWSMYKVVVSQDSKTYIEPRQASDDSAESLISLIDPESLLDRYNDSLPRNQKQVEFLLIKNENFAPFLSSAASSTAPVANSKKGKSGKKSSSAAPSSSSPQSDAIKNYLESLYEDFTAAHYMRHFSGFISNLSNRLYGTSPAGAAISCDNPLFERIKAFKISFIGSSQVKIFFYLQFNELEDPHYELRLKFSTQISSLFPTSCVSMLEQTDRNWTSIIELLKSKKPSASVVSASSASAVSASPAQVAAQSKSSKKKEKAKAKKAAAVVPQADKLETSEAIAAALIAEQQEIEAQELQAKTAALEAENARQLKLKEEAEARALARKQEKERLESIESEKRRIQSEKDTKARLERDAAIQAENLRKQAEIREHEAAKAAEKQERERQAAEKREIERQAALEASRLKEKRENELRAKREHKQKQEQDRKEQARIREERRLEQARMEQARIQQERLEQERLEQERIEQERLEQERIEQARLEQARIVQERLEQARMEQARIQQEKDISAYEQLRLENEALKRQLEFSRSAPQSGSFGSNHGESPASSVSSLNNSPFYSSSHANPPPPGFAARQQYSPQATSGYLQYQGPLSYTSPQEAYAAPRVEPFSPQSYGQGHQTTPNSSGSFTYQSPTYPQSGILQVDPASRPRGSSILDTGSFHSAGSGSATLADSFPGLFASPRGRTSTSAPLSRVVGGPVRSPPAVESTPPPLFDFTGFLSGITEPTSDEIYQPSQQQPQQQYPPHQGGGSFW
jgi:hypothetical protein